MPLVDLIMPKGRVMSKKSITLSEMVSHRKRNQGYGDFSDVAGSGSTISKLLFGEYVLEHFKMASDSLQSGNGNYNSGDSVGGDFVRGDSANEDFSNGNRGDMAGAGSLDYELEYILEGHASDRENMETVASKLLMVRFVPDYAYIQTDSEKKAEAEAAALTLCTVIGLPELSEGAAQGILLAWAYGEAIMDIRTLISGGKVPLVKNAEDWKLSLSGLMQLGSAGENVAADRMTDMEKKVMIRLCAKILSETDLYDTDIEVRNLIDWICVSEQIKSNNNEIRSLTGEYKRIEPDCREGVRTQLERMKSLCKERDRLYEKQNDLKGQKQKIEKSLGQ